MIVVHLRAVGTVSLRQVGTTLAGITVYKCKDCKLIPCYSSEKLFSPTCIFPILRFACADQCSLCTSILLKLTWPSGVGHNVPRSGTSHLRCLRLHAFNVKKKIKYFTKIHRRAFGFLIGLFKTNIKVYSFTLHIVFFHWFTKYNANITDKSVIKFV